MNLFCRKFDHDDPFKKRHIYIHKAPEGHGIEDRRAMTEEAKKAKEKVDKAKKTVERAEKAKLMPETAKHLLEKLDEVEPLEASVAYAHITYAIEYLDRLENMKERGILDKDQYGKALDKFDKEYEDFIISPKDIRALEKSTKLAEERLRLLEAHSITDKEKIKNYVLNFVLDPAGNHMGGFEGGLEEGKTFTFDFKDPDGNMNRIAQNYVTLGHVMKAALLDYVTVIKPDGKRKAAYLWKNGKTYDRAEGSPGTPRYVAIYHGDKFETPAKEVIAALTEAEKRELYGPKRERPMDIPVSMLPAEGIIVPAGRALSARDQFLQRQMGYPEEFGDFYIGEHTATRMPPADEVNMLIQVEGKTTESYQDILLGSYAELPPHFRGQDSYEHIEKMKDLEYGKKVYEAIEAIAQMKGIDNRTAWEMMRGGIVLEGGRWIISFNEICMKVWGENQDTMMALHKNLTGGGDPVKFLEKWRSKLDDVDEKLRTAEGRKRERLLAKKAQLENNIAVFNNVELIEKFFDACTQIMQFLPETAVIDGVGVDSYKELREDVEYEEGSEMYNMDLVTGQFFDKNYYGPPVKFSVFKAISYTIRRKDRPTITEDTWMSSSARFHGRRAAKKRGDYGEMETTSHARAYDRLMETRDMDTYIQELEKYMLVGAATINSLATIPEFHRLDEEGMLTHVEVRPFTDEDKEAIRNGTFVATEDQKAAIRHGAMIEAQKELKIYQDAMAEGAEEEAPAGENPVVNDLIKQVRKGEVQLSDEEINELRAAASNELYGVLYTMVESYNLEDIDQIKIGLGGIIELPHGFQLEFMVDQGLITPRLTNIQTGVSYQSKRLGRKRRWRLGAHARAGYIPQEQSWGASVGATAKMDFREGGAWGLTAGAYANLEVIALSLGVERDLGRVIDKRIENYKEAHKEEIQEIKNQAYAEIDAIDIDDVQKEALKASVDSYIDDLIARGRIDEFIGEWYQVHKRVRFVGAGLVGAVGWKGGTGVGAYITLGTGLRADTNYKPQTFYTNPPTGSELPEGAAVETPEGAVTAPKPDWVAVEIPDEFLWAPEAGADKDTVKNQAVETTREAVAELNEQVGDNVELELGERFLDFELVKLNGTVRLYIDPESDFELIQDGPQNLALNLGPGEAPYFKIRELPVSHGGKNVVEVVITDKPERTFEDVIEGSPDFLTWDQTLDGRKTDSQQARNVLPEEYEAAKARSKILTSAQAATLPVEKNLSVLGAQERVKEVRYTQLAQLEGVRDAKLFESVERHRPIAKKVATRLLNEKNINYDDLATSGRNEEINTMIIELYLDENHIDFTHEGQITLPHILLARQYAMEMERPDLTYEDVQKWNSVALETLAGDAGKLAQEYYDLHKDEINDGGMKEQLPEGSEFFVYINEKGMKLLHGYYDSETHGDFVAMIEWDVQNPEKTLTEVLGTDATPENIRAMKEIAYAIKELEWPESPFTSLEATKFTDAYKTIPGTLLLSEADALYGPEAADQLRTMVSRGSDTINPELAKQYAEDVYRLFTERMTVINGNVVILDMEYRSALYDNCYNLTVSRNYVLRHAKPKGTKLEAGASRNKVEKALTAEPDISYKELRVPIGVGLRPTTAPVQEDVAAGEVSEGILETVTPVRPSSFENEAGIGSGGTPTE